MMIRRVLAAILFFAGLPVSCAAQPTSDVRIDSTKPTVYLAFERLGENGRIWLRLHNNTQWTINLRTENPGAVLVPLTLINGQTVSAVADGSEVSPEYLIENVPDPGYGDYWCNTTRSWVAPGQSAIFSFPGEHLKFLGRLSVSYKYEWESEGQEPDHRVRFNEGDLRRILTSTSP
jgi:hypothetical protein